MMHLGSDEHDAQRNGGLDGWPGHVDEAKGGAGQREAVGERECGDGHDQTARALDENQQRENEHQVVDAAQDVLEAEHQVGPHHFEVTRYGGNREG
jgi:hypothetical protein